MEVSRSPSGSRYYTIKLSAGLIGQYEYVRGGEMELYKSCGVEVRRMYGAISLLMLAITLLRI